MKGAVHYLSFFGDKDSVGLRFVFKTLRVDEMMKQCKTRFVDIRGRQKTTNLGKVCLFVHRRVCLSDS